MLVTLIVSCLLYLVLLGRCFCDLFETARPFDFVNEWILYTVDAINSHALSNDNRRYDFECEPAFKLISKSMVSDSKTDGHY